VKVFAKHGLSGIYAVRVAEGVERDELWRQFVRVLPGFANYPTRVGGRRQIPVVVLTPEPPER
jgi:hypothetical protein